MNNTLKYLKEKLQPHDKIVIGVSAGPDSMCLLSLLLEIKKAIPLDIIVAHVHHNVRQESDEEAVFLEDYCHNHDCIFEMHKIEHYNKDNFHEYARNIRYQFFNELVTKYQANYLMTAHHGDDLIETILMRLTRGTIFKGYAGFAKETNNGTYTLLRPLIHNTKNDIAAYNELHQIPFRLDKSNEKDKYTRNRYRHNLLPFLKAENKNVHLKFLQFSDEINLIENFLAEKTTDALTKVLLSDKVCLCEFNKLHPLIKKRVIEYILKEEYQNNINHITLHHVQLILDMCNSPKANLQLSLPDKKVLIKSYNELYFKIPHKPNLESQILEDTVILNSHEKIEKIAQTSIDKSNYILRLNSQEVSLPLKVRCKKTGDKMQLKNASGHKKIKDIFIDSKIPLPKRNSWPIVVDNNDTILWIPGLKKSKFDKNNNEKYDIIYKYVKGDEKLDEKK